MNPVQVQQNPTDVAHRDLQNVLLNGRILINGMSLTGNELGAIVRGEQMLFAKATQLDKANALVANQEAEGGSQKKANVLPFKKKKPNKKKD